MWIANNWKDYEVIDCSCGEKLERWGNYTLVRPDPQVIWDTPKKEKGWKHMNAHYHRSKKGGGEWEFFDLPEQWSIHYGSLTFQLKPFSFKHTGLFPEQAVNWDWFSDKIRSAKEEEISAIDGIGPVIAGSLTKYFAKPENNQKVDHLLGYLHIVKEEKSDNQIFAGMNFVITGSLEHFSNRGEAKNLIESLGGKVTGSVTGKTNYLINNDVTSNSSKNKKARELGIPILSEEDFLKLTEESK